eukprot:364961-Chlamydomonas_euryale.AAC.2
MDTTGGWTGRRLVDRRKVGGRSLVGGSTNPSSTSQPLFKLSSNNFQRGDLISISLTRAPLCAFHLPGPHLPHFPATGVASSQALASSLAQKSTGGKRERRPPPGRRPFRASARRRCGRAHAAQPH